MTPAANDIVLPTRRLGAAVVDLLKSLKAGDRVRVVQTVRVGSRKWAADVAGAYRGVNYLATGVTTDRVAADDVVVPTVHFVKDNGEFSSVTLDENTRIERG